MEVRADEPPAPDQVLAAMAEALAEAVAARRDELQTDRRQLRALVDELLLPRFDLASSCRVILHEHWRTATAEQRQRFIEAFYGYLLASYGDALLEFRHDTVRIMRAQDPLAGSSTHVHTTMKLTSGDTYKVDYYMRLDDSGWRVVDVLVEGMSYVRSFRTNFGLEIRADGLEALIVRLEGLAAATR